MTEPPKFKFLDDKCSDVDLTEDKTHQRIADQLFDLIESGDSKGLTIGLEGDWGSGKSTVIELLRKKLAKDKKTFFFYIDTWAHEGDPLRRAFLEAMIDQLKGLDGISDSTLNQLDETRKQLNQQRTKAETTRTTETSKFGMVVGICALFVPFGVALVASFAPHVTVHWTGNICWGFWWGFLMSLAPVWAYAVQGMRWISARLKNQKHKVRFSVFLSTSNSQTDSTTTLAEERSSLEFAHCFESLVKIGGKLFDRIVMVIDNLDRIDQKDALRIWSTLQTFMQRKNPEGSVRKGLSRWIIVPYAQEGLEKIWRSRDEPGSTPAEDDSTPKNLPSQEEAQIASFMDKSFDLRLHVPQMVISGWQKFAMDCIKEAAPELPLEQTDTILDVLVLTRDNLSDAPSPRQIKLYVNHVGLLWKLHHQHVSLTAVCYYVVIRYLSGGLSDDEIKRSLRKGIVPGPPLPMYSGPLGDEMASILYGIPKVKATQILIAPLLEVGLKNSEIVSLHDLRKNFIEVFDSVACHVLTRTQPADLPKTIALIQRAFEGQATQLCKRAFQRLQTLRFNTETIFQQLGHDNALALISLAASNNDPKLAKTLAEAYIQRLPMHFALSKETAEKSSPSANRIETGEEFIERLKQVSRAARQDIKLPYAALDVVNFPFQRLEGNTMDALASCLADPDEADAHLARHIDSILLAPWMVDWLSALIRRGVRRMDNVLPAIEQQLNMEHITDGLTWRDEDHQVWELLLALDILPRNERPVDFIQRMLCSPVMEGLAEFLHPGLIYLLSKYRGEELADENVVTRPPNSGLEDYENTWSASDPELGKKVYIYSARSGEYEWLASEAARPNRELARDIIQAAVEDGEKRLFDVSSPFKFLVDAWNWTEDRVHDALLDNFVSSEKRLESLGTSSETITEHPQMCRILLERCKTMAVQKPLVDKCLVELRRVTQEKWEQDFGDPSLVKLVVYLQKMGASANLGLEFYSAFKGLLADALDEGYVPGLKFDELASLYHAMDSTFHTPFGGTVGRKLLDCKFAVVGGDFARFLVDVPDYSEWLNEKPSEILDSLAELAQEEDLAPLFHFASLLARHRDRISYWAKVKNATRPFVEQLLQDSTKEKRTWGQKIAQALDVTEEKPSGEKGGTKQKGEVETEATREGRA